VQRVGLGPATERFAYLPFGAGPPVCIGAQFALAEAVLVLAALLRRFRLELETPRCKRRRESRPMERRHGGAAAGVKSGHW